MDLHSGHRNLATPNPVPIGHPAEISGCECGQAMGALLIWLRGSGFGGELASFIDFNIYRNLGLISDWNLVNGALRNYSAYRPTQQL